jgi:phage protein U
LILKIDETQSEILANGIPQVVAFSLTLKEYGDDSGGFDALSFGIAALNTLSRLL